MILLSSFCQTYHTESQYCTSGSLCVNSSTFRRRFHRPARRGGRRPVALQYFYRGFCLLIFLLFSAFLIPRICCDRYFLLATSSSTYEACLRFPASVAVFKAFLWAPLYLLTYWCLPRLALLRLTLSAYFAAYEAFPVALIFRTWHIFSEDPVAFQLVLLSVFTSY